MRVEQGLEIAAGHVEFCSYSAPDPAPIHRARVYYDRAAGVLKLSVNGQPYQLLSGSLVPANPQVDNYTLALDDAGQAIDVTKGSAVSVTVPPNASVPFPVGTVIEVSQLGAGTVSIAPGDGVTINSLGDSLDLAGQYAVATLRKLAADTWLLAGALA
jgi:hypothetical protein